MFIGVLSLSLSLWVSAAALSYPMCADVHNFDTTTTVTLHRRLTFFTFQTKYDFTVFYGTLITCLWAMIGLSIIQIFIPFSSSLELMYSAGGASLFSLFIVVDTQMMLNKLSTDEYILCAINLYLDIINLFLYILQAMSRDR